MTHHDSGPPDDIAETITSLVREAAPDRFHDGFAARVHARLLAERELSISRALERQFVRIVPFVAAAALVLAAINWWGARGTHASPLEAALNLPQVTLATAYSSSSLFGTAGAAAGGETP